MGLNETITVINKSNKVVKSSKHIVNVFKDAKSAYLQRKAEIAAERNAAAREKQRLSDGMKALRLDDDTQSRASSRHSRHSKHRSRTLTADRDPRPSPMERGYSDPLHANDATAPRHSRHRFEDDLAGSAHEGHRREMIRRHTEMDIHHPSHKAARAHSARHIDMDLAYGDVPPPLPLATTNYNDEALQEQASKLQMLLDEADCAQHTVTAMVENLQKNPDALAAVALTLAEISALVKTMGPGVLTVLKGSFPAIVALLASPQFMIAAGVGVGVTIVALGGYKIIRKLQTQQVAEEPIPMGPMGGPMGATPATPEEPYQLDELETKELSRIEMWRRGIAEVEADNQGTIVDGEFVTPGATRHLVDAGVLDEDDIKSRRHSKMKEDKEHRTKSHRAKSVKSTKTSASRSKTTTKEKEKEKEKDSSKPKKKKEPSVLRSIFAH